jgi:hypothetical protein
MFSFSYVPPFVIDRGPWTINQRRGLPSIVHRLKTKIPSSTQGRRKSPRYHPNYVFKLERSNVSTYKPANVTLVAITGVPVADYFAGVLLHSPARSSFEWTGEFGLITPFRG